MIYPTECFEFKHRDQWRRWLEKLIAEGKMTEAGYQKIAEAKENGEWDAAIRREQVDVIPQELDSTLRKIDGAISAYHSLSDSRKKQYIYWLQTAKREATKQRRTQKMARLRNLAC